MISYISRDPVPHHRDESSEAQVSVWDTFWTTSEQLLGWGLGQDEDIMEGLYLSANVGTPQTQVSITFLGKNLSI